MIALPHSVGRQTLDVEVASEKLAFALQPRLSDLNRRRLVPVVERVLDALAVPGRQIRIARLEVDLGVLPLAGLEEEAEQRLERELRRALAEVLDGAALRSEREARREILEHWLLHGTLPEWAPREIPTLAALVAALAEDDPEGLAALVRRLGQRALVRERLARQLREPALRRLAGLEEPEAGFDELLDDLPPREGETLKALLRAFARIPSPYRPRPEELVRRVIADEVLLLAGEALSEIFFERVLGELFTWPLAEPVRRALEEEAAAWSASGRLPAAHAAAFAAAVAVAAHREPGAAVLPRGGRSDSEIRRALESWLDRPREEAEPVLRRLAADRVTRERWARILPEEDLARLTALLEPRRHRALSTAAQVLAAAWSAAASLGHPSLGERGAPWSFLLEHLARTPAAGRSLERLVAAFFARSAARWLAAPAADPARAAEQGVRFLARASRFARAGGHTALLAVLRRGRRRLLAAWDPPQPRREPPARKPSRPRPARKKSSRPREPAETDAPDTLYIDNAGLVIAAAFLPQLFQALDMLADEEGEVRLRDPETASRAVHLLQLLVDGRTAAPEPQLALNKILCGLPLSAPVDAGIEPTDQEAEICDKLLRSILAGWQALANTSIPGLQETFLQREGKLHRGEDGWKLTVQRKTLDVLVDEIPWSHSMIFHRFMPAPLHVSW